MLFSRTIGVKHWICPNCGHQNRSLTNPPIRGWLLSCTNAPCQRRWAFGEVMYPVVNGQKTPPIDLFPPETVISSRAWRSGSPINQALCSGCSADVRESLRNWTPAEDSTPPDDTTKST